VIFPAAAEERGERPALDWPHSGLVRPPRQRAAGSRVLDARL